MGMLDDMLTLLPAAKVGFIGLFTTIASFIFEAPKLPSCASEWLPILGLALVCSCFGFTLQPVAQRRIPSERASQFCALNPLSTAAMSAVLLHEKMGVMGAVGAALILGSIMLESVRSAKSKKA